MKNYIILKIYNVLIGLTNWLEKRLDDMEGWIVICPRCHKNKIKLAFQACDECLGCKPKFEEVDSCCGCGCDGDEDPYFNKARKRDW